MKCIEECIRGRSNEGCRYCLEENCPYRCRDNCEECEGGKKMDSRKEELKSKLRGELKMISSESYALKVMVLYSYVAGYDPEIPIGTVAEVITELMKGV